MIGKMTKAEEEILALCVEIRSTMAKINNKLDVVIAVAREMNRDVRRVRHG